MNTPVYLVACVAQKLPNAAPAADLYQSDWFRKARAYVELQGAPWFILSALHGVVAPDEVIAPYDHTLLVQTARERRLWGELVTTQLAARIGATCPIVFLAGRLYREPLAAWAGDRAAVPMQGLGIGQQKAWLARAVARAA